VASAIKPCFKRTQCPSLRSIAGMINMVWDRFAAPTERLMMPPAGMRT
jgi:hypothetical protein